MVTNLPFVNRVAIWVVTVLLLGAVGANRVQAQGGAAGTATILGTVTDNSGAVIPGASVEVKNVDTGISQSTVTDAQGRYDVPQLLIGNYQVQVTASGFRTLVHAGITLTVGSETVIPLVLEIGQTQQTITIQSEAAQVETTTAAVSSLVDQTQMRQLPLNGRDIEQLIVLAPGVQSYPIASKSALQGEASAYSVSGARADGQILDLDGQNLQTFYDRGFSSILGTSLGVEAISEFQMLTDTYGAQFGGSGAVMNAVTKSGTNSIHGSAFDFLRNSALDSRGFFDPPKIPEFRRNQFGGSVGGPIKKDKLFFFGDYEGIRQGLGVTDVFDVPDANAHAGLLPIGKNNSLVNVGIAPSVASTLAIYPVATTEIGGGIGSITNVYTQPGAENYYLARIDYTISSKDSVLGRYIADKANLSNPVVPGTLLLWPETDNSFYQFLSLQEKHIFSPRLLNTAYLNFSRENQSAFTANTTPALQYFPGRIDGSVAVTGLSGLGAGLLSNFYQPENRFLEGDDLIWTHGAHTLAFGGLIERLDANTLFEPQDGGAWTFNSLQAFLTGTAASLKAPLPNLANPVRDFREINFALYAQDDWKVTPKLTLNLGLRWEPQTNPVERKNLLYSLSIPAAAFVPVPNVGVDNPSLHNFDPRVGLAYAPFAGGKTSIRAGFGIFHEILSPAVYAAAYDGVYPYEEAIQQLPVYPTPFTTALEPTLPSGDATFNYFGLTHTAYAIQYNLTVQQQIAANTVASVGYVGSQDVHEYAYDDVNPIVPTVVNGVDHFATLVNNTIVQNLRLDPSIGSAEEISPIAHANYNSLQASLNRRFSANVQAQLAYTYSKCLDDVEYHSSLAPNTGAIEYSDEVDPHIDYGPCAIDYTNRLVLNGLYALPLFRTNKWIGGWQFTTIVSYNSGFPLSVTDSLSGISGRPNVVPGCNQQMDTRAHWYNPACYTPQPIGTVGDLAKGSVWGPGLFTTDMALIKDTKIPRISEAFDVQFRAEFFNIFNNVNFGIPSMAAFAGTGSLVSTAGNISSIVGTSRQIQFGLKFLF